MNKKYTVFLSSTYEDLREERNEVIHALLEMDCIPCGMEYFPSDNDEQFEFIKSVIDECDYYIVIIAGRYGSIGKSGKSYTEMEYRYALKRKIPVFAFIHNNLDSISLNKSEKSEDNRKKLELFIKFVSKQKMVNYWNGKEDLAGKISRTMISAIRRHPAIGWVRGNYAIDSDTVIKMQRLYEENIEYKEKNKTDVIFDFAENKTNISFDIYDKYSYLKFLQKVEINFLWIDLFKIWGKIFLEQNRSYVLKERITKYVLNNNLLCIKDNERGILTDESFSDVSLEFISLGLLEVVHPNIDVNQEMEGEETEFRLTKNGLKYLTTLIGRQATIK